MSSCVCEAGFSGISCEKEHKYHVWVKDKDGNAPGGHGALMSVVGGHSALTVGLSTPPQHSVAVHCEAESQNVAISPSHPMVFEKDSTTAHTINVTFLAGSTSCEEITCHACPMQDANSRRLDENTIHLVVSDPKDDAIETQSDKENVQTSGSSITFEKGGW